MARAQRFEGRPGDPAPRPLGGRELERRIAECAARLFDPSMGAAALPADDRPRPLSTGELVRAMRAYLVLN